MYEGQINASEFTMECGSLQKFYIGGVVYNVQYFG
jgi:hypothetical protein